MKKSSIAFVSAIVIALLSACAAQEGAITQDIEQAVRDFIAVREMAEADEIRTASNDRWEKIDQNFIIYEARKGSYLIEFSRRCHELDEYPVVPDARTSGNVVRARFDTLRGCRIAKMFPLTEGETAELMTIGESPGSRN
jgi:hypothetical protein